MRRLCGQSTLHRPHIPQTGSLFPFMSVKPGRPPVQSDLLGAPPGGHGGAPPPAFPTPPDPTHALPEKQTAAPRRKASLQKRAARKPPTKPENPLQGDLFARPLPPRPKPPRTQFDAEELRISEVPASGFSPQAAPDGWLYLVTEPDAASQFLNHGLPLRKTLPPLLTERGGVAHWLAKMTENSEGLSDAPPMVLRVRRTMIMGWLEPDPDHSAEFSAPCYLLSGSRQEQD